MDLQKLIRLALFSCIVRGFFRPLGGTSVAVYLSDECRCETSKITRMRLYSTEIEHSGGQQNENPDIALYRIGTSRLISDSDRIEFCADGRKSGSGQSRI